MRILTHKLLSATKVALKDWAPSAKHAIAVLVHAVCYVGMPVCKTISDWFFRFLIANEINFNG